MKFQLKSKHLFVMIIIVILIYIGIALGGILSLFVLETSLGKNLDNVFIIAVVGLFLYMRHLRKQENANKPSDDSSELRNDPPEEPPADTSTDRKD